MSNIKLWAQYLALALPGSLLGGLLLSSQAPAWTGVVGAVLATVIPCLLMLERRERQLAEAMRHHAQFAQCIIDVIPHPVYVKDAESRYLMVNRSFVQEMGMPASAVLGQTSAQIARSPADAERSRQEDAQVLAGHSFREERNDLHPLTGGERYRLITKGCTVDWQGRKVIVGSNFDMSRWYILEQELMLSLERERVRRTDTHNFIQRLIDIIPDPVYIKKAGGRYVMVNDAFATYHGKDKKEVVETMAILPVSRPETRALSLQEDDMVLAGGEVKKEEHTIRKMTGEEVFRIVQKRGSVYVDGDAVVVGIDHHITRWRLAERELHQVLEREVAQRIRTERFVQDLMDVIPDPVYLKSSESRYLMVNDAFARIWKRPKHMLVGLTAHELADPEAADVSAREDHEVIEGKEILKEQHSRLPYTNEECYRIVCKRRCVHVDGEPVVVGIDHYITEWRLAERELKRLAEEDMLTGMPNRRHFTRSAERSLHQAARHNEAVSLLIIDLDHFKQINDTHGHNVGDEVLMETAARIQAGLRKSDMPGRWGGEEFVVLLPHTPLIEAMLVSERLREAVSATPFQTSVGPLSITLSGGCAQFHPGEVLDKLVERADAALYQAKHGGRNRIAASGDRVAVA